ncbi:MAG: proton-conducting transporter membrane subunit [Eubacteriales bacterium]|nr:proton-conducting transporter membrane subunit [Eubacteriales bacterium]
MILLSAILCPFLGAIGLFLLKPKSEKVRNPYVMAVTVLSSVLVALSLFIPGDHQHTWLQVTDALSISFRLDGLGRVFGGLVAFLWPLATLYGLEYMRHEGGENTFFGFYLLSYFATLGIAFSEDLMTLYIFYELLTLATLPLVMHGMGGRNVYAGRKYLYYSLGGAALGFIALVTVVHYSGNSNFVYGGIPAMMTAPMSVLLPVFVIGFFGFGAKAAVFPLHGWLPTASIAPTPVTALLHAVAVVKAGAFAVIRMSYYCFSPDRMRGTWAQSVCLCVAAGTILIGSAMAVREQHLKRRLAYSTMSNLSYVLFGALLLTPEGLRGGLMHMVFHALMKISLFSCVGAIMIQTGKSYVADIRGMSKRMPFICAVFLFCAIELVGIPPFVGFQSKWALATAGLNSGSVFGLIGMGALIVSAVLTAIYLLVPAVSTYALPLEPTAHLEERSYDPGWRMKVCLGVLCVVMLALAFFSAPLVRFLTAVAGGQF